MGFSECGASWGHSWLLCRNPGWGHSDVDWRWHGHNKLHHLNLHLQPFQGPMDHRWNHLCDVFYFGKLWKLFNLTYSQDHPSNLADEHSLAGSSGLGWATTSSPPAASTAVTWTPLRSRNLTATSGSADHIFPSGSRTPQWSRTRGRPAYSWSQFYTN